MATYDYNVVIVGGGMVGATLASALGSLPLRVAVVEANPPKPFSPEQPLDLRVSAISIASRRILEQVGAWNYIAQTRLAPFRRMKVWETFKGTEFRSRDIHYPELGYIIENRLVQLGSHKRIEELENVDLIVSKLRKIDYSPNETLLLLEDNHRLKARLLIGADGARSVVRQAVGIGVSASDYEQMALVLTVRTAYGQQDITWQRFTPRGPQAFLPLPGPHASLVWYDTYDETQRRLQISNEELLEELYQAFPRELGDIERILDRGAFPLRRQHAHRYVKAGVALVGDAAHTIHPLAGQGANLGFLDVAALSEVLAQALREGKEIGDVEVLRRYELMRRRENTLMMRVMDAFYHVFGLSTLPVKLLRNFGLNVANQLHPARIMVMRYAMGLEGRLPRLARGEPLTA